MRAEHKRWSIASWTWCLAAFALTAATPALSEDAQPAGKEAAASAPAAKPVAVPESQVQARAILMRMAEFLAGAQRFSFSVNAGYDAVQKSGQKIEFGESRKVALSRPDKLRIEGERSDGKKTLTVFNGTDITLVDSTSNVYATAPQPGNLDESIVFFVSGLGIKLPLAALLLSRMPTELDKRVQSVDYVEKTTVQGIPTHHIAARTDQVDFQIWVADGDQPLPQRVVITYKKDPGQPQFWAQFSDWNMAPEIGDSTFTAQVPDGAQKVAFVAQLPRLAPTAGKPSAVKGAK